MIPSMVLPSLFLCSNDLQIGADKRSDLILISDLDRSWHWSWSFWRRENFFGRAKISEKKDWVGAIDSVQKSSKSELSSRFLSRLKSENSLATFGRIQPIVPRFIALYPPLWHKSRDDRLNSPKTGVWNFEFSVLLSCVSMTTVSWWCYMMMQRWYADMIMWWNGDMIVWWYGDMLMWWHDDMMVWWWDDRIVWWCNDMME